MESALDILSRAAGMVDNARILKQALKKGSNTTSQRKQNPKSDKGDGNDYFFNCRHGDSVEFL